MSPNPKLNLEEFLPDFNKDLIFKQINGVVDIYRDSWGIPHIKTKDEFDLFFAQGFATAQDRLWHMDFDDVDNKLLIENKKQYQYVLMNINAQMVIFFPRVFFQFRYVINSSRCTSNVKIK